MGFEIDHHAAALHWMRRKILDAQRQRADMLAELDRAAIAVIDRADDVLAGAETVVENDLRLAVAIGVEQLTDMSEAVPLRRILQRHLDHVVADHIDPLRVFAGERIGDVGHALALVGDEPRRMAPRVDDGAAGIVERQAEAEGLAFLNLGDAFLDLVGGQQVEPAQLIVRTPIAPGRACRAAFPTRVIGHNHLPNIANFAVNTAKEQQISIVQALSIARSYTVIAAIFAALIDCCVLRDARCAGSSG